MRLRLYLVFGILLVALVGYGNHKGIVAQDALSGESSFEPDGKDGPRSVGRGGSGFFFHK